MKNGITGEIEKLKVKRNAVILAHNYQPPEIQDIADYTGDSLELSRKAAAVKAGVIVFCGVHFMAETASILSPGKKVLLPDLNSGCPMANMIDLEGLKALKKKHPGAIVVAYVNTTAAVKTECDICCTSANAEEVVRSVEKGREIIFVPDKYLGQYVSGRTGRGLVCWEGCCPIHARILPEDIIRRRKEHPGAKVLVHPECTPAVTAVADAVLSTSGMCRYARESSAAEFIVGTEKGILHRMGKENPGKKFYPASELAVCENMKRTTLEKVLEALETLGNEVKVPEEIRLKAIVPIERMLKP
jgi:quinolinate synthase